MNMATKAAVTTTTMMPFPDYDTKSNTYGGIKNNNDNNNNNNSEGIGNEDVKRAVVVAIPDYTNLSLKEIEKHIKIPKSLRAGPRGGVKDPFPTILYRLLQDVECLGYSHIISWHPTGKSFIVHSSKLFEEIILQKYFNHTKFASFQRQLNLYGFKVMEDGIPIIGHRYHPLFIRDRPETLKFMIRKQIKKNNKKNASRSGNIGNTTEAKPSSPMFKKKKTIQQQQNKLNEEEQQDVTTDSVISSISSSTYSEDTIPSFQEEVPICVSNSHSVIHQGQNMMNHIPTTCYHYNDHNQNENINDNTTKNSMYGGNNKSDDKIALSPPDNTGIFSMISTLKVHAQANNFQTQLSGGYEPISFTNGTNAYILNQMYNNDNNNNNQNFSTNNDTHTTAEPIQDQNSHYHFLDSTMDDYCTWAHDTQFTETSAQTQRMMMVPEEEELTNLPAITHHVVPNTTTATATAVVNSTACTQSTTNHDNMDLVSSMMYALESKQKQTSDNNNNNNENHNVMNILMNVGQEKIRQQLFSS